MNTNIFEQTNIPFLLNVITNEEFLKGGVSTHFIDSNPQVWFDLLLKLLFILFQIFYVCIDHRMRMSQSLRNYYLNQ